MDAATLGTLVAALVAAVMGGFAAVRSLRPQRIGEYDVLLAKYTALVNDLEKAVLRLKEENDKLQVKVKELQEIVGKLGGKL